MKHTLVAAFDTLDEALTAKSELLMAHVLEGSIQLSSSTAPAAGAPVAGDTTRGRHDDESLGHKIGHFFAHLFGNDDDDRPHRHAIAYPEAYRRGATLLTVTTATDLDAENIEDILERNGAFDIDERAATWAAESLDPRYAAGVMAQATGIHSGAQPDRQPGKQPDARPVTEPVGQASGSLERDATRTSIPVIEENLRIGKRQVNTGRVRVVSRVTERPVEQTVSLHEEHAHVERHPVDRPATAAELDSFKAGSIEIQETAEEVVVEKTARVVEEVTVGRASSDHQETVHETVRRTDVEVQSEPGSTVRPGPLGKDPDTLRKP